MGGIIKRMRTRNREKNFLWKFWMILGILCLAYGIMLLAFTGFSNIFYMIWLPAGAFFLIFARMAKIHFVKRFVPKWLQIISLVIICILAAFFLFIEALILSGFYKTPKAEVDYVIVLGARVRNGNPSSVLKNRLDAAFDYAMDHEDTIVIVSGGQGNDEIESEAYSMARYLEGRGLDESRILLEEKSTDTNENLTFSKALIEEDARVAIVSNDFHIFRAVHLARHQGYENPQALAARDVWRTVPANLVREFFGVVRDWAVGNMDLFPLWE